MKKNRAYYRTAALLSAQPQRTVAWSVPKPSISLRIPWKWVALVVVVAALSGWLLWADDWYLDLGEVRVAGTASLSLGVRALKASELLGIHRFLVNPAKAAALIREQMIEVTDARIECTMYPAACVIRVVERVPVFVWITESGTYWIDKESVVMPAFADRPGLPRIYGMLPDAGQPEALQMALEGLRALAALGIPLDGLEYTPQRGLIWTDAQGRRVAFGVGPDMLPRLKTYEFLIKYLDAKGVSPQAVDVRFPEGPTYSTARSW